MQWGAAGAGRGARNACTAIPRRRAAATWATGRTVSDLIDALHVKQLRLHSQVTGRRGAGTHPGPEPFLGTSSTRQTWRLMLDLSTVRSRYSLRARRREAGRARPRSDRALLGMASSGTCITQAHTLTADCGPTKPGGRAQELHKGGAAQAAGRPAGVLGYVSARGARGYTVDDLHGIRAAVRRHCPLACAGICRHHLSRAGALPCCPSAATSMT